MKVNGGGALQAFDISSNQSPTRHHLDPQISRSPDPNPRIPPPILNLQAIKKPVYKIENEESKYSMGESGKLLYS